MLELDLTNLSLGLELGEEEKSRRRRHAVGEFARFREEGLSAFFQMVEPVGRPYVDEVLRAAEGLRAVAGLRNYVNLGIGGSALGGKAVLRALLHPLQNEAPRRTDGFARFYYPDNVDPETNAALLDALDPAETLLHVASKSGATAETAAQMMIFLTWMERALGRQEATRRVIVSTDPEKGDLRALVMQRGFTSLTIPSGVGGRFSVFGSVGLLPMALFGLDVEAFVAGAAAVAGRCQGENDNPALELALALHAQHVDAGRNIMVMMSYSDALALVGDWFGQLWAESLGKNPGAGSTPVRAVGATDQHSQLQLYMEGPADKVIVFLRVGEARADVVIPPQEVKASSTGYLEGKAMSELIRVESRATEKALTDNERPNGALEIGRLDERALGGLLYFLQLTTVYAGGLYRVNPFDQPGVEFGKRLTYGYFGRSGYESEGERLREYESRPRKTLRIG